MQYWGITLKVFVFSRGIQDYKELVSSFLERVKFLRRDSAMVVSKHSLPPNDCAVSGLSDTATEN